MALAAVRSQLAPSGVLRAAVNLSNILLVTGKSSSGEPQGVAPDMAREIAGQLGVPLQIIPFAHPDKLCEAAASSSWDISLVGADPDRAAHIDFTAAYCEIQVTCLLPQSSGLRSLAELDVPGTRIAVKGGGAYDLWLSRNLKHAQLVRADTLDTSYDVFHADSLEALAGLRPKLLSDLEKHPGSYRLMDAHFMAVQQAVGCLKCSDGSRAGIDFLREFVARSKASGLVQGLLERHGVNGGLSVAGAE
ncbi:unnamed protein product [Polarella glacialis]|uniref:Solute-binding protein family 3/N-terminal domain-containing protein n=1 Tax=Polarella glacialis TaxID=89957 RepID=A0A813IM96_POLGL|nr:unnamed protein product [Polarella glacialis]CAE8653241.1 unnamed protein product [Polarella glacialis]CAE8737413.1 unnamed protein product [Polarella glacialis]